MQLHWLETPLASRYAAVQQLNLLNKNWSTVGTHCIAACTVCQYQTRANQSVLTENNKILERWQHCLVLPAAIASSNKLLHVDMWHVDLLACC
jgi:hypothetical protein